MQFVKYTVNYKKWITYTMIIYNFKKSKHVGENDLNWRHCFILLLEPPCFIILDIVLAHNDLNFSRSLIGLAIQRISAQCEAWNVFEGILLDRYGIFTIENEKGSLFLQILREKFLFTIFMSISKKMPLFLFCFYASVLTT